MSFGTAFPAPPCLLGAINLPATDLNALAIYVQSFHPAPGQNIAGAENMARGKLLFQQICAACHGTLGNGKRAPPPPLAPPPTNLTREQPDPDYIMQVIRDGVPGTAIASNAKPAFRI